MTKEFELLKSAARQLWPPKLPTYILRPEHDAIIYYSEISPGIYLYMTKAEIVDRIRVRVVRNNQSIEEVDMVDIWIEPGYMVIKEGRVIWSGGVVEEMVLFVMEGVSKRVEKKSTDPE